MPWVPPTLTIFFLLNANQTGLGVEGGGGNGIHGPDSDFLSFSGAKIVPKLSANFKFSYGSKKDNC